MIDQKRQLPEDLSALNLRAFLTNEFGACGCSELETMLDVLKSLLTWVGMGGGRVDWNKLYSNPGIYYLLMGALDRLGLTEHGISIRHPWLTPDGTRFLAALMALKPGDVDAANGEGYDGIYYPDLEGNCVIEGLERLVTAIAKLALIGLLLECMIAIGSGIVWTIRKLRRKDDVWRIREISD